MHNSDGPPQFIPCPLHLNFRNVWSKVDSTLWIQPLKFLIAKAISTLCHTTDVTKEVLPQQKIDMVQSSMMDDTIERGKWNVIPLS